MTKFVKSVEMDKRMETDQLPDAKAPLLQAVSWLCRPLVRLLIRQGITYPQLRELLKGIYVEVAEADFTVDGKSPSDSRIYILTGVHRKDIKRLRRGDEAGEAAQVATLGGAIVARWLALPEFLDANGEPRCLPRDADERGPGFDDLVASVSKDVRPRAILDEWLRLGMVSRNAAGDICLDRKAFVPAKDFAEQAFFMSRNVHDHLATCVHNLLEEGEPMLERSVYYDQLTSHSVAHLRELARYEGMALLQKLNAEALHRQQHDAGNGDARQRMRFGVYWYEEARQTEEMSR